MTRAAEWWEPGEGGRTWCRLCPHECDIPRNGAGRCWARRNESIADANGRLAAASYGRATSVALDPMEKKPLYHFLPGRGVYSVGLYGCNLGCRFCQNHEISQGEARSRFLSPEMLAEQAVAAGAAAVAFTYNEPLVGFEYVKDGAKAARDAGLRTVAVTNGYVNPEPLAELLPLIDAWNVDLKAFDDDFYRRLCGGSLAPVLATLKTVAKAAHLEVTTLLLPGENDDPSKLDELAKWVAGHCGPRTPAHVSAYTPRYKMASTTTTLATTPETVARAREIFRRHLSFVYAGNVRVPGGGDTICPDCGSVAIRRDGYGTETSGMAADGRCGACGGDLGMIIYE